MTDPNDSADKPNTPERNFPCLCATTMVASGFLLIYSYDGCSV